MVNYEWTEELCRTYAENMRGIIRLDHRPWAKRIARKLTGLPRGSVILDIASGPGFLLLELGQLLSDPRLIAQDLSEHMRKIAAEEAARYGLTIETAGGSAEAVELGDQVADVVTCKQLLHECLDVDQTIASIFRLLKPGGRAFIIDFNKDGSPLAAYLIRAFMILTRGGVIAESFWKSYSSGLSGALVEKKMRDAGFVEVEYVRSGPNYLMIGTRGR